MSLGSTQKGKAVESLIAATCIIGSEGKIAVSIPFVDDEGIDLFFTPKGGGKTIAVQVKSRFTLNKKGDYSSKIKKNHLCLVKTIVLFLLFMMKKMHSLEIRFGSYPPLTS